MALHLYPHSKCFQWYKNNSYSFICTYVFINCPIGTRNRTVLSVILYTYARRIIGCVSHGKEVKQYSSFLYLHNTATFILALISLSASRVPLDQHLRIVSLGKILSFIAIMRQSCWLICNVCLMWHILNLCFFTTYYWMHLAIEKFQNIHTCTSVCIIYE